MVCDDCFETDECRCGPGEMCGSCFESKVKPEDVPKVLAAIAKPECQHPNKLHTGSLYDGPGGRKDWLYYSCPDCEAKWREEKAEPRCEGCGHASHSGLCRELEMPGSPGDVDECGCLDDREPPLTPEEEEEAPPDRIHPADCVHEDGCKYMEPTCENACKAAADELVRKVSENACEDCLRGVHGPNAHREEPPPQPERRPPYLVAYSVSGHLFEVALPGDATVRAVDGALVIQHHLGPVAGIVSVLPVINKESSDA